MSNPDPSASRRSLLRFAAVGGAVLGVDALTGCTVVFPDDASGPAGHTTSPGAASSDADVALLSAAIADEEALLDFCTQAVKQRAGMRELLVPIQLRERSHLTGLRAALSSVPPRRSTATVRLPQQSTLVVRTLGQLVSARARRRFGDCLSAHSGLLARLFASVSASHQVTVESIRGLP